MRSRKRRHLPRLAEDTNGVAVELSEEDALPVLQSAAIIGGYRIPWGSNYTCLVGIDAGRGKYVNAIYKPRDGERPLYDFPRGSLYKRELATFLLSRDLGWPSVPLTLVREGPYGIGTVQQYIDCDPEVTYFDLIDTRAEELQRFAVFDLLVNNADRKAGHCLLGNDGRVWSIDHGLTFHPMLKLRTVMLELWGQPIPEPLLADLEALLGRLRSAPQSPKEGAAARLAEILAPGEMEALEKRLHLMLKDPVLPALDPYRNVPWPWV